MQGSTREWDHICINPNGGTLHVGVAQSINSANALQVNGRIHTNGNLIAGGTIYAQSTVNGDDFYESALFTNGAVWATGKITSEDIIKTSSTQASTSTTTGALRSAGGLGVVGNAWIGGSIDAGSTISVIRSDSNPTYISTVGNSTFRMYHMKDSTVFLETFTNHQLTFGTNSTPRLEINTAGNVNITSNVASSGAILGGTWTGAFSCVGGGTFAKNLFIGTDLSVTNDVSCRRVTSSAENNHITFNKPSAPDAFTRMSFNSGAGDGNFDVFIQRAASNWSGVMSVGLRGTSQNEGGRMTLLSTLRGTSTLDLGSGLRPNIINVRQGGGLAANQIGCNLTAFTMTSAQSLGFTWHSNTSSVPANWEDEGIELASLTADGELRANSNMFTRGGLHIKGFWTSPQVAGFGDSLHLHFTGGVGSIFGYNYAVTQTQPWRSISLGNDRLFIADGDTTASGHIGIGTTSPAYPLDVQRSTNGSFTGGYGYLSSTATGFGGGTGTVAVSIRASGRIVCPEFNSNSDRRLKTNIKPVTLETAMSFIKEVEPVRYNLRGSEDIDFGYIAQSLLETSDPDINDIVSWYPNESMKGEGGTHEPTGWSAAVNYNEIIPLLHRALKDSLDRIEVLTNRVVALEAKRNRTTKSKK
jgi:hypothetical protein